MPAWLDSLFARTYDLTLARSEADGLREWRAGLLAGVSGQVLEIGPGTGLNLPHYPADAVLTLLEPSPGMRTQLAARLADLDRDATVLDGSAEDLPFDDAQFDVAVTGLVLCSVSDPTRALAELHRVLKPGGTLVFIEHVRDRRPWVATLQRIIQPVWGLFAGGCQLHRDTGHTIQAAGFELTRLDRSPLPGGFLILREAIHGQATAMDAA